MAAEFEAYFAGWRRREADARAEDRAAQAVARTRADELARVLVERYGARRVLLVGSLARGEFRRGSDIDLAVEGIADGLFFAAGAELEALAGGIHVDLVPLESATAAYRERTLAEGVRLA
jgi:predicted nucleotidyltransferase